MSSASSSRTIPRDGEIAVIGLGKSGAAAVRLLRKHGYPVYASDASTNDAARALAADLARTGATVDAGHHDLARIGKAVLLVVSPGIPPEAPPLAAARASGVEVISEIELALRCMPNVPYIAVTGTNGKTTTTALIGHLLRGSGYDAVDAGNIGVPLADVALRDTPPAWVALELSSFQLHDTPSIAPKVGVLTNLSPDHLDRYPTVDAYYGDKMRLFANARPDSIWVLNADDDASMQMTREVTGEHRYFTVRGADETMAAYAPSSDSLTYRGTSIIRRDHVPLLGNHNVANVLAAWLAVASATGAGATTEGRAALAAAIKTFRPPPHRLELVGEWDGVQWINDSKATNVSSTYVAVDGMIRPTILLLGGRHKGEPYTGLADPIRAHVKRVIAYGESAGLVEQDLRDVVPVERGGTVFETVIERARAAAVPGDAILLSPACSSYDMFKNYEERGVRFRALAAASANASSAAEAVRAS